MKQNIIDLIKSIDSTIDINTVEYSNNNMDLKDLISLHNFRLQIYTENNRDSKYLRFLERKIECLQYIYKSGIKNIKMVSANNKIYFFDENFNKILLIINNLKGEITLMD